MPPQTQSEKEQNRQRKNLIFLHNSILSAWNFKKFTDWKGFYQQMGQTEEMATQSALKHDGEVISYSKLKEYLDKQKQELEERIKNAQQATTLAEASVKDVQESPKINTNSHTQENTKETSTGTSQTLSGNVPQSEEPVKEVEVLDASNNYGYIPSPKEHVSHFWFQKKAIVELYTKIFVEGKRGLLLLSGTGTGKTFMCFGLMRKLLDINFHEEKTFAGTPYLFITKTTVVEQQKRVARKFYEIDPITDTEVINIESLRSKAGSSYLLRTTTIENGEEVDKWKWKWPIHPCVVFFDESQGAKNSTSTQHKIMCAYSHIKKDNYIVHVSATPFTRVSEAKCFAISTRRPLEHLGFPQGSILSEETWPSYSNMIASPAKPDEYVQAAIERLMEDLKDYVVRVRNVKPQFNAINSVKIIPFENDEKMAFYNSAWERFLKEKAKLEAEQEMGGGSGMEQFTILLKFAMAAEFCHAEGFADSMYKDVQKGLAAVAGVKFKGTIIEIVKILTTKYGVPRNKISLVWGGGQTQLTKKQKAKQSIKNLDKNKLEMLGMTEEELLESVALEDVEDRVIQELPEHLRLGPQDLEDRQEEIDRFQDGRSLYCIYTFKAGGVGLSLHHTDEFTEYKCRRKDSGFAVEEDIPNVPVRKRKNRISTTYNAIELAQGLGRVPRISSLSDTEQEMFCYQDTIEMDIGYIVSQKLRCLSSVVKMHESWADVILGGNKPSERALKVKQCIDTTKDIKQDEEGTQIDPEGEDE